MTRDFRLSTKIKCLKDGQQEKKKEGKKKEGKKKEKNVRHFDIFENQFVQF